ncbi:MAG TPA: hypothetical protein VK911_15800 [Vicinamibacterales bacterium]|nr:hypothetical protein [Vicinamibacterales bacterium]
MRASAPRPFPLQFLGLRWPRPVAIAVCGLLGVLLPAAFGALFGVRAPVVHDEFSYLLGADTLSHGRLANPAPALPEFFEAPHVLVAPTYASKYPPGQPLVLALGQALTGRPIWGVWLGCGLFGASLCWMLQAWAGRRWALALSIVVLLTLGTSSYWAQSYWGGMLPATGAALVLGGMRRLLVSPLVVPSVATAVGAVLLASTRPYEGLLVCLPAAALILAALRRDPAPLRLKLRRVVLPFAVVGVLAGTGTGIYNDAVTGDWRRSPYLLHLDQYFHQGPFLFSAASEPTREPVERVARFYDEHRTQPLRGFALAKRSVVNLFVRSGQALGVPFGFAGAPTPQPQGYRGVLLWLALLVPAVWVRARWPSALALVLALAALECAAWLYLPKYPFSLLPVVVGAWLVAFLLAWPRNRWGTFIVITALLVLGGQAVVWWWSSHYSAPAVPLILAGAATALQRLRRARGAGENRQLLGQVLVAVFAVHLATLALTTALASPRPGNNPGRSLLWRADLVHRLESNGGRHLVFVRYAPGFTVHEEWVYNGAALADGSIVFAHDLGAGNAALIEALPGRSVWVAKVSERGLEVEPYRQQRFRRP